MKYLYLVFVILLLSGCAKISAGVIGGQPVRGDLDSKKIGVNQKITDFITNGSANDSKPQRNNTLGGYLQIIDANYSKFESKLRSENVLSNAALDIAAIGLSGAASRLTGGLGRTLSAISSGVSGSQSALNNRFLQNQATSVLISQMRASRLLIRAEILEGMSKPITEYPTTLGISDIERYFLAGTLSSALSELSVNAGNNQETGQQKLTEALTKLGKTSNNNGGNGTTTNSTGGATEPAG